MLKRAVNTAAFRRTCIIAAIVGAPVAIICCGGGGDDSGAPKDGGGSGTDSSSDGSFSGDASPSDASRDSNASDASDAAVCTSTPCVVQISAGGDQTCALINDGTIRCWGQDFFGQLGTPFDSGTDASAFSMPQAVPGISGASEVITTDWGPNGTAPVTGLCGFSCARVGTAVSCWGCDNDGELGRGDASIIAANPTPAPVQGLSGATQIASDSRSACALLTGGALSCWGYDIYGELGPAQTLGTTSNPFALPFVLEAGAPTHVVVGRYHTCAVLSSGQVACWGKGQYDMTGTSDASAGTAIAAIVPGVANVVELASSGYETCARTTAGDVLCWGRNNFGQLGRDAGPMDVPGSVGLPAGKKATLIGVATNHACARLDDDTLWCWGRNFGVGNGSGSNGAPAGQIGPTPDGGSTYAPQQIVGLTGKVVQVVGGYAHTCALIQGGSVECWGSNTQGQLGRAAGPDLAAHPAPAPVEF